jgi:hypothetical protein
MLELGKSDCIETKPNSPVLLLAERGRPMAGLVETIHLPDLTAIAPEAAAVEGDIRHA